MRARRWLLCVAFWGGVGCEPPPPLKDSGTVGADDVDGEGDPEDSEGGVDTADPGTDSGVADTGTAHVGVETDPVQLDADGDGVVAALDCDDRDPAVHPGATEMCNRVDDDCNPATTSAGMVSFVDAAGDVTQLTDLFTSGTTGTPAVWRTVDPGTLFVCAGAYTVALEVIGTTVDIVGVDGLASTTLSGGEAGPALSVLSEAVVDIEGLALTGGDGDTVRVEWAHLTGRDVAVSDNPRGRGVGVIAGEVALSDCQISNNVVAGDGGGVYLGGSSELTLERCTVDGNRAQAASHGMALGWGGGLAVSGIGVATLTDSALTNNQAVRGGGLSVDVGSSARVDIIGGSVSANQADVGGGAQLVLEDRATVGLSAVELLDNVGGTITLEGATQQLHYPGGTAVTATCDAERCG